MKIDFYILEENNQQAREFFACRLIEKAYARKHRVYVECNDKSHAEEVDDLLWCYKDESFIPHNIQNEGPIPPPPIQLGYAAEPRGFDDILINLSNKVPNFYQRFKRIIEIISNDEAIKSQGREHYKYYRQQGFSIQTHQIALTV
jgi:DNA polymerase-3 subunit chi